MSTAKWQWKEPNQPLLIGRRRKIVIGIRDWIRKSTTRTKQKKNTEFISNPLPSGVVCAFDEAREYKNNPSADFEFLFVQETNLNIQIPRFKAIVWPKTAEKHVAEWRDADLWHFTQSTMTKFRADIIREIWKWAVLALINWNWTFMIYLSPGHGLQRCHCSICTI